LLNNLQSILALWILILAVDNFLSLQLSFVAGSLLRLPSFVISEVILMLQALLLLRRCVIIHVVFVRPKDAGWLHSSATLGAENALNHDASAHVKRPAIIADPVVVRNLVYAVAPLVNWDIASTAEDDQVLILIVPVVADGALGILLHHQSSLVRT